MCRWLQTHAAVCFVHICAVILTASESRGVPFIPQLSLVLINQPRGDGTLSWRWYTADVGGIRTHDLAIASPTVHRTQNLLKISSALSECNNNCFWDFKMCTEKVQKWIYVQNDSTVVNSSVKHVRCVKCLLSLSHLNSSTYCDTELLLLK